VSQWRRGAATTLELDDSGIAWITLSRPDAANARNQTMRDELLDHYRWIATDPRVRVVVLTGEGDRAFCAGMDLKEASSDETDEERRARLSASRDIDVLAELEVPTIAAVNGFALGGGAEMALACDLRVMADEAQFGLTEVQFGLVPGGGGTQRLPRLIGVSQALAMIYLGERISGPDAVGRGIAYCSVPRDALLATCRDIALRIAAQPPEAVRVAKSLVRSSTDIPLTDGLRQEFEALLDLLQARQARVVATAAGAGE
jgi:methylglutaconyl-CoA hydratase